VAILGILISLLTVKLMGGMWLTKDQFDRYVRVLIYWSLYYLCFRFIWKINNFYLSYYFVCQPIWFYCLKFFLREFIVTHTGDQYVLKPMDQLCIVLFWFLHVCFQSFLYNLSGLCYLLFGFVQLITCFLVSILTLLCLTT